MGQVLHGCATIAAFKITRKRSQQQQQQQQRATITQKDWDKIDAILGDEENDRDCLMLAMSSCADEFALQPGTVRKFACEAMMMRTDGASYGDRERFTGPTFGRS